MRCRPGTCRFGLGSASGEITFVAPKGNASEQGAALFKLFHGLSLGELANATSLAPRQILDALPDNDVAFNCLMETSTANADTATHALLFEHKVRAAASGASLTFYTLMTISSQLPAELSPGMANFILASPGWAGVIKRLSATDTPVRDDGTLLALAGVMPVAMVPRYLQAIEPLPISVTREARAFAEFVLALHAPSTEPAR